MLCRKLRSVDNGADCAALSLPLPLPLPLPPSLSLTQTSCDHILCSCLMSLLVLVYFCLMILVPVCSCLMYMGSVCSCLVPLGLACSALMIFLLTISFDLFCKMRIDNSSVQHMLMIRN
ncbi:hypothetical protein PVAP13_8KG099968 [Panicum virgatum]|uniref:Uncharacterized protein n=1 Tax=Panicum virgatum TaxID=38727 RepID=A0A8T0PEI8_PANVG|nr:hypothetical protein PVAP13_8KG099968 [Panicum virgatum]